MVFKHQVANALLSGLEAEVPRGCDYDRRDTALLGLARRAQAQEAQALPIIFVQLFQRIKTQTQAPQQPDSADAQREESGSQRSAQHRPQRNARRRAQHRLPRRVQSTAQGTHHSAEHNSHNSAEHCA